MLQKEMHLSLHRHLQEMHVQKAFDAKVPILQMHPRIAPTFKPIFGMQQR